MEKQQIAPGINMWEDFLTDEEQAHLLNICTSLTQEDWEAAYIAKQDYVLERDGKEADSDWVDRIYQFPVNDPIITAINERLHSFIKEDGEFPSKLNRSQRHYPGSFLKEHHDSAQSAALTHAIIIYLNDDYVGGELYFRDLDIELKPPAKSLLKFSSAEPFTHGIRLVQDGPTRFVLTTFVWDNEESCVTGK
jgi:hypothetical protein